MGEQPHPTRKGQVLELRPTSKSLVASTPPALVAAYRSLQNRHVVPSLAGIGEQQVSLYPAVSEMNHKIKGVM